jgi:hypothetical protein
MTRPLSPIALFVYARPEHTRRTLAALQNNQLARQSELFIFADAAKDSRAKEAVTAVRKQLRLLTGFAHIEVIERHENFGLARSIVDGVSSLLTRFDRLIVLEDDLVTAPGFLPYMNEALTRYATEAQVMHVSGYFFPPSDRPSTALPDSFFYNQTSCWGWGTWARAWQHYEPDATKLLRAITAAGRLREFDLDGTFRFSSTLKANAAGRQHTWAIKWHASVFLQHGLCLHPRDSLVHNIGHDQSGTNSTHDTRYDNPHFPPKTPITNFPPKLVESKEARAYAAQFLTRLRPSLWTRIHNLIRRR